MHFSAGNEMVSNEVMLGRTHRDALCKAPPLLNQASSRPTLGLYFTPSSNYRSVENPNSAILSQCDAYSRRILLTFTECSHAFAVLAHCSVERRMKTGRRNKNFQITLKADFELHTTGEFQSPKPREL